ERSYSDDVTEEEAELDKNGKATLRFATDEPKEAMKSSQDFLVSATVTDATNQAVTAKAAVVAHRSPFYLGLRVADFVPQIGRPFPVQALAVDDAGKPRAAEAELVVTLHRWECNWAAASGGYATGYH